MRVVFTSFGEKQIDRRLLRLEDRVIDPRPIYRMMAQYFYDLEKELFKTEGESGGKKWAPLKESTMTRKARKGQPMMILEATGDLKRSLTQSHSKGSFARYTRQGMEAGSNLHYGGIHYYGSPKTKLPRRRPVQMTVPQRVEWLRMMQRWVML